MVNSIGNSKNCITLINSYCNYLQTGLGGAAL